MTMKRLIFSIAMFLPGTILLPAQEEPVMITNPVTLPGVYSDLKILSWNICMLPHLDFKNSNRSRAEAIAEELNRSDYEIIVFQEAFDKQARNIIREVLQKNFPFFYGPANHAGWLSIRTNSGLWIASKVPLTEIKSIQFEVAIGLDRFANKGATLLEGEWQGQSFQLIATHIQSDEYVWDIREKQLFEINSRLLVPCNKPGIPQIICGDFNTDREEQDHYSVMLKIMDAQDGQLSGNEKYSFSSEGNEITMGREKPRLIDYILVRNAVLIKSITRKIAVIQNSWSKNKKSLSDHNAIEATIRFSEKSLFTSLQYY
jgi:sphingomyelin phosphodiesterase